MPQQQHSHSMLSEASYHNMTVGRIPSVEGGIQPTIFDAKGDLLTATANDTPARVAVGTNEHRLVAASGETTGLKYVADTTNYAVGAKGDLLAGTAADTVAALAVGANDTVLTADSTAATGLKWATPSSGGMTLISTTTLSGSSVTLSSIPSTYKNLEIVIRNFIPATTNESMRLRINGDSGASRHAQLFWNTTSQDDLQFDSTSLQITREGSNSVSQSFHTFTINDYANTVTWKSITGFGIVNYFTTTTKYNYNSINGFYNQTGAVSSLTFFPNAGNFTSGTILLYGVK
jgi:hypothetical protein